MVMKEWLSSDLEDYCLPKVQVCKSTRLVFTFLLQLHSHKNIAVLHKDFVHSNNFTASLTKDTPQAVQVIVNLSSHLVLQG